jgi:hypothetical protein
MMIGLFIAIVSLECGAALILHLEQPAKHSKRFPRAINPANVRQKLRQLLKPIDAHPVVAESARMGTLEWRVS